MRGAALCVLAVALGGCLESSVVTCEDGSICAPGTVCAGDGRCVDQAQLDACAGAGDGEGCAIPGVGAGLCVGGACVVVECGNGVVEPGEACDDPDPDVCTAACAVPTCGDGTVQTGEECDDGAANADDRDCTSSCLDAFCGDGKVHAALETCDDLGANADDQPCTSACQVNVCGDGAWWPAAEACDDGDDVDGGGCAAGCVKVETCGDAFRDAGEDCDDGNVNPVDGCDACVETTWLASAMIGATDVATDLALPLVQDVAAAPDGTLYVADVPGHRVLRVDPASGAISTAVGTGIVGSTGDGGLATSARVDQPSGLAVDGLGNLYVADKGTHRVRKVHAATGTITTIAGKDGFLFGGFSGDGGPATDAELASPEGVAVDGFGNVYIADGQNQRIRRIDVETQVITTFAGGGSPSDQLGDGGPADQAYLSTPMGVAVDAEGNVYVADASHGRIRRIDVTTRLITTFAGTGTETAPGVPGGFSGDGGPAADAELSAPEGVAVIGGHLYIADRGNARIRHVDLATTVITTIAGGGVLANLISPSGVAVDLTERVYLADFSSGLVQRIADGAIATVAGGGDPVASVAWATSTAITDAYGVAVDDAGNVYFTDSFGARVLRADVTGTLTILAAGFADEILQAAGLAVDAAGDLYVSDRQADRVWRLDPDTGAITTFAGGGFPPDGIGDGLLATQAYVSGPSGLAFGPDGDLYIVASGERRVRRVDAATGVITTVAGDGGTGDGGDGGLATSAQFHQPADVVVDPAGNFYVSDYLSAPIDPAPNRVRRVDATTGVISAFAGTSSMGFSGDGGPATSAKLSRPTGLAIDSEGAVYIVDLDNRRVRRVKDGVITTFAGNGSPIFSGDGGAPDAAGIWTKDIAIGADDALYIGADAYVRVAAAGRVTTVAGLIDPLRPGPFDQAQLADPRAITNAPPFTLVAGGASGTVQAIRPTTLDVVAGRYPHPSATSDLARFRASTFGTVGGVAYDVTGGVIYLTETNTSTIHAVTVVDPDDETTWTITALPVSGLRDPTALLLEDDALLVADTGNHVVRAIDLGDFSTTIVAGRHQTLGFFGDTGAATSALLYQPQAITRCPNGDLFVADTGNHRVRRIAGGTITTVLGDGVAASSGEGGPATTFPVDTPLGLACDGLGNLFVTSSSTVRLLPASDLGVVDGTGEVQTIYAAGELPTYCLTGLAIVDAETVQVTDSCTGTLLELWRQPLP